MTQASTIAISNIVHFIEMTRIPDGINCVVVVMCVCVFCVNNETNI